MIIECMLDVPHGLVTDKHNLLLLARALALPLEFSVYLYSFTIITVYPF